MAISSAQELTVSDGRAPGLGAHTRVAIAGAVLWAGAVTLAATGSQGDAAFGRALLEALIVGVPIAVGLYALRAPINRSFGLALLGIGFAWSLTALTESSLSVPYTLGRLSTWLIFPCVVYLLLAFPDGRINRGLDRWILIGVLFVLVVLFLGTAPFVGAFPPKTLWGSCTTDCPANAVFVLDVQPAILTKIIYVREWLVELLWIGLFVSMVRRFRAGSPLQRRAMGPPFIAAAVLGASHFAHITTRQLGVDADTVIALSSVWTFCIVAVCAAFLGGLVWRRMLLAQALARLGTALRGSDDRGDLRDALATAVRDPTLEILFRDPGSDTWQDAHGHDVRWPATPAPGAAVTTVGDVSDHPDVALVHDVALLDDSELLNGVTGMLLAGWRREQLTADLEHALKDLESSRRRLAEAADLERVRIERDIHDGAQQRLVGLRIRLGMAEELLDKDPAQGARVARELGREADLALEELRTLARDVYPPALADLGLAEALRSVARAAPLPVSVTAHGVTRHEPEIEGATYFTCVEAIQNALKHARDATAIRVELREAGGLLRFEIRDDGAGPAADAVDGRGVRNMHDRIEAIGGRLTVQAVPGRGTRVVGSVPLRLQR